MENFKGTINGVVFTDKEKFYEMLEKLRPEEIQSVELSDYKNTTKTEEKKEERPVKQPVETQEDNKEVDGLILGAALLYSLFKSFQNSLEGHNHVQPLSEKEQKKSLEVKNKVDFYDILSTFVMKPTTYCFTGESVDELELNKFEAYLKNKFDTFSSVNFEGVSYKDFLDLREKFAQEFKNASSENKKISKSLEDIDVKLAKYEELIKLFKDLGKDTSIAEEEYNSYKSSFCILSNKREYYNMLTSYYSEICHLIDVRANEK